MDNPGIYTLSAYVTAAGTQIADDQATDLQGLTGLTIDVQFVYGAGGTSVKAYLQTALGAGPYCPTPW